MKYFLNQQIGIRTNWSNKGQSALEFIILMGVMIFFTTIFFAIINENLGQKNFEKRDIAIKEIASNVQDEINLALRSTDGYSRQFKIPTDIYGEDYDININDDLVYVRTSDSKHAIALPVPDVNGDVKKGDNKIKKEGGRIYLNY